LAFLALACDLAATFLLSGWPFPGSSHIRFLYLAHAFDHQPDQHPTAGIQHPLSNWLSTACCLEESDFNDPWVLLPLIPGLAGRELRPRANDLAAALRDKRVLLEGDSRRHCMGDLGPVTVAQRISHASNGSRTNIYGPTPVQRTSLRLARAQFSVVEDALRGEIEAELLTLRREIEAAGVPWTPGRGL
jgi:hypothetical protein